MFKKLKIPGYEADEIVLGLVFTIALHGLFVGPFVFRALRPLPQATEAEKPRIERPFVSATLLKLGAPLDPKKLPDRFVPRAKTAPKPKLVAARQDPLKVKPDAGPPPIAEEGDLRLNAKNDPFAEDAGKDRPEEGHTSGSDAGTETDPSKVRAGDAYAAALGKFFHDRWTFPSTISQGEANRLCVSFQVNITTRMSIWYVKEDAIRKSSNELFDDSARSMLQKMRDDHVALPEPPPDVAALYKGRTLILTLSGAHDGDNSRCK